jgi:hypothetical protein
MTDEAAKACWFPAEAYRQDNPPKLVWGKDRTFESVDEAVTFVMEELSAVERSHASVVTPSRLLGIDNIEQMYAARKA